MPEPPVIITGGSITVKLNPTDFPGAPAEARASVRIAGVEVRGENNELIQVINFPNGKFTLTLLRTPENPK